MISDNFEEKQISHFSRKLISTKVRELAALREGEPDERKMKTGEGRIGGRRLRVRLPDVVVVDVEVRSVGRGTHLRNVRRGLVGHRFPVDADKPRKSLFFVSIICFICYCLFPKDNISKLLELMES